MSKDCKFCFKGKGQRGKEERNDTDHLPIKQKKADLIPKIETLIAQAFYNKEFIKENQIKICF